MLCAFGTTPRTIFVSSLRAMSVKQKVCLIVIDGWGITKDTDGNAIHNAKTPVMDRICAGNATELAAHGEHVGLPDGLMGNSEVGHLNIGAGRVVYQDILRINRSVRSGDIIKNEALVGACDNAKAKTGRLHLLGLVSDGGVHSHIEHMKALVNAAKVNGVPHTYLHFFSDGRDTSPTSGVGFVADTVAYLTKLGYGQLSTLVGRYYAMDRDKRWERIQVAYEGLVGGEGEKVAVGELQSYMTKKYSEDVTDEFMRPVILSEEGRIRENDTIVFFDFRSDRMREITETLGIKLNFESKHKLPAGLHVSTFTQYNKDFPFPQLFGPASHKNVLAEWLATQKVPQYHCAETEKYAHVTFFFNGGCETSFEGEERGLVPSPKVPTYDHLPQMSSVAVADDMVAKVTAGKHPFIMCNFAPPDMVGHTGDYAATVIACEATDTAIGRVEVACKEHGYTMMVTSDHGNAEKMFDGKGGKHTAHTCNKVPFTSSGKRVLAKTLPAGRVPALCDVAATVLAEMGLDIPKEMDGVSLLT